MTALRADARARLPYWHLVLQAFASDFLAHASYAVASFLGLPVAGGVAESMHDAAPLSEPQLWKASMVDWQSPFLLHAAAGLAHVLSMHLPQSVPPMGGAAGGAALVAVSAGGGVELSAAPLEAGAEPDVSSPPELAAFAESDVDADSSAGVSGGGLDPPQASQANGTTAQRARVESDRR